MCRKQNNVSQQKQNNKTKEKLVMAIKDNVSREQFDADLAAEQQGQADYIAADTDYIAAVDAFIALPPIVDLAAEDATVNGALNNINTAKDAVIAAKARIPGQTGAK
jgi:hypothetical protein